MPRADEDELVAERVGDCRGQRDEPIGRQPVGDLLVQLREHPLAGESQPRDRVPARVQAGHEQGRGEPLPGDVGDHRPEAAVGLEEIVDVAADRVARVVPGGDLEAGGRCQVGGREQHALHPRGRGQLRLDGLQPTFVRPGFPVLVRDVHHARQGRHDLQVRVVEHCGAAAPIEVQHAGRRALRSERGAQDVGRRTGRATRDLSSPTSCAGDGARPRTVRAGVHAAELHRGSDVAASPWHVAGQWPPAAGRGSASRPARVDVAARPGHVSRSDRFGARPLVGSRSRRPARRDRRRAGVAEPGRIVRPQPLELRSYTRDVRRSGRRSARSRGSRAMPGWGSRRAGSRRRSARWRRCR